MYRCSHSVKIHYMLLIVEHKFFIFILWPVHIRGLLIIFQAPLFTIFSSSGDHLSAQQHKLHKLAVTSKIDGRKISSWEPFPTPKALVWYNQVIVSLEDFWRGIFSILSHPGATKASILKDFCRLLVIEYKAKYAEQKLQGLRSFDHAEHLVA